MPAPSFVTVPVPVVIPVVDIPTSPAPPKVKLIFVAVIPPEMVFVPASALIRDAVFKVIAPDHELVPEMKRKAPSVEIPVPFSVNVSPTTAAPCNCKAAPEVTDVPEAEVPKPVAF